MTQLADPPSQAQADPVPAFVSADPPTPVPAMVSATPPAPAGPPDPKQWQRAPGETRTWDDPNTVYFHPQIPGKFTHNIAGYQETDETAKLAGRQPAFIQHSPQEVEENLTQAIRQMNDAVHAGDKPTGKNVLNPATGQYTYQADPQYQGYDYEQGIRQLPLAGKIAEYKRLYEATHPKQEPIDTSAAEAVANEGQLKAGAMTAAQGLSGGVKTLTDIGGSLLDPLPNSPENIAKIQQNAHARNELQKTQDALAAERQRQYPYTTAISGAAGKLVAPEMLATILGTGGVGELAGGSRLANVAAGAAGFTGLGTTEKIVAGQPISPGKDLLVNLAAFGGGEAAGPIGEALAAGRGPVGAGIARTGAAVGGGAASNVAATVLANAAEGRGTSGPEVAGAAVGGAVPALAHAGEAFSEPGQPKTYPEITDAQKTAVAIARAHPDLPDSVVHEMAAALAPKIQQAKEAQNAGQQPQAGVSSEAVGGENGGARPPAQPVPEMVAATPPEAQTERPTSTVSDTATPPTEITPAFVAKEPPKGASNEASEQTQQAQGGLQTAKGDGDRVLETGLPKSTGERDVHEPSQLKTPSPEAKGRGSVYEMVRGGQKKWLIQEGENPGFGDTIHNSPEEAAAESTLMLRRDADRAKYQQQEKEKQEAELASKKAREDLNGFDANMNPMQRGNVVKQLTSPMTFRGEVTTRRDVIRKMIEQGRTVEGDRLIDKDGNFLGTKELTKAGIEYAKHLIAQKSPASENAGPTDVGASKLAAGDVTAKDGPGKGMTRLYRGETAGGDGPLPDWVKTQPKYQATKDATGRWFYDTHEKAQSFANDFGNGKVSYVDVPTEDVEKYRASNQPDIAGHAAEGRASEEFFVPKEIADARTATEGVAPAKQAAETLESLDNRITEVRDKLDARRKAVLRESSNRPEFVKTDAKYAKIKKEFDDLMDKRDKLAENFGPGAAKSNDPNFKAIGGQHNDVPAEAPRILKAVASEPMAAAQQATGISKAILGAKDVGSEIRDELARYGQRQFPAMTREAPKASEAASAMISTPETRKWVMANWMGHLAEISKTHGEKLEPLLEKAGATFSEDQLRGIRDKFSGPEGKAFYDAVKTYVGKGSTFETESDYQKALNDPAVQEVATYFRSFIEPTLTENYKLSSKWDSTDEQGNPIEPPARGKDLGLHISLAIKDQGNAPDKLKTGGGVRNTLEKHSPFEKAAKGTGDYDTHLGRMLDNALGRSILPAADARFTKELVDSGKAVLGKPGDHPTIDGKPTVAIDRRFNPGEKLFVRADLAGEVRSAFNIDQHKSPFPRLTKAMTAIQLVSGIEMASHIGNATIRMIQQPIGDGFLPVAASRINPLLGKAVAAFERAPVGKIVGVADSLARNTFKLAFKDLETSGQMARLAELGALQPEGPKPNKLNLPAQVGRLGKTITDAARLSLAQGYDRLAEKGIVPDSPTNKRDYINQLGQYHKEAQAAMVKLARESGLGPFATAGSSGYALGMRNVFGMDPGVRTTSAKSNTLMRLSAAAQIGGIIAAGALINYARTGYLQPKGTPWGSLYLHDDKDGKPVYYDLAERTGARRAARTVGLDAAIQGTLEGRSNKATAENAARQGISAIASPYLGALPTFGIETATGVNPHGLYSLGKDQGPYTPLENIKSAITNLNPSVSAAAGGDGLLSQLGSFAPRTGKTQADIDKMNRLDRKDEMSKQRAANRAANK